MSDPASRYNRKHETDRSSRAQDGDDRSEPEHDRDRILYSPEFRRLAGITQVISPSGSHPTHNRLTHSLEVAQIARAIAKRIASKHNLQSDLIQSAGGLDLDVVEAAALAHDIGHPPFGHVTEDVLNERVRSKAEDGFEGNAQTFRILTTLAVRHEEYSGLDLTRATLSAVSKYPWPRATDGKRSEKWGAYSDNLDMLTWSRQHLPRALRSSHSDSTDDIRTLEACIMDWADDVAYAVHDIEDFYRVGMIPLDRLKSDTSEQARFIDYHLYRVNKTVQPAMKREGKIAEQRPSMTLHAEAFFGDISPFEFPYSGKRLDRANIRRFSSKFVNRYIQATDLVEDRTTDRKWKLAIEEEIKSEVELLKSLLWMYVIESEALISLRYGYAAIVRSLFDDLVDAAKSDKTRRMFPEFHPVQIDDSSSDKVIFRAVADFLASLTESQLVDLHHRLTGVSLGSALNRIVT